MMQQLPTTTKLRKKTCAQPQQAANNKSKRSNKRKKIGPQVMFVLHIGGTIYNSNICTKRATRCMEAKESI